MRHDFLVRMATGLALVFPLAMIAMSTVTSLLHPRYFIPMLPGVLLLAVASAGRAPRSIAIVPAVNFFLIAVVFAWMTPRVIRHTPGEQLALLEALKPEVITGGTTDTNFVSPLRYYIPLRVGVPADLRFIQGPIKIEDLPQDNKPFWVFNSFLSERMAREWLKGLPIVCHYPLESGSVYVLARAPEYAPGDQAPM